MATVYMNAPSTSFGGVGGFNPHQTAPGANGKNGNFAFKKRFEHIDWRKIASIDVDQISRTLDFNALQENIMNLTFCNIESELDMRMVDPNFVKLFKLAQFTIEYLLHSQDYLAGIVAASEEKVKLTEQEMIKLKEELEKLKEELTESKKESHKRKKLLIAQQQMIHSGSDSYNKCPFCSKAFLNASFLQSHIFRRHHEFSSKASSSEPHQLSGGSMNKTLEAELNNIKDRLHRTEAALKEEKKVNRSLKSSLKDGDRSIVNISSDVYNDVQQHEIDEMRKMYEREIREVNMKLQASERALIDGHRSNLGDMQDDDDDRRAIKRQREDAAILKEQLQEQLNNVEKQMSIKLEKQERKWSKKVQNMSKQHADELHKLNNALEDTNMALIESKAHSEPHVEKQLRENEDLVRKSREQEKMLNSLEEEMIRTEELRKSAEFKRKQVERERRIRNETVVETFTSKQSTSPQHHSPVNTRTSPSRRSPGRKSPAETRKARVSMYPSDDEDEESTATGLLTGTGSFKGTGTLGSSLGSALGTREFVDKIRQNITIDMMGKEFDAFLNEKLGKIGVDPKHPYISDRVRDNKLAMLKTQRQSLERKYVDFARLRQRLDMEATSKAKEKMREMQRSPATGSRTFQGSRNPSPAQTGNRRTFPQPSTSSGGPSPRPRGTGNTPKPTPRSTSPNKNLQSTGSTTEWTSTNWDSDESEGEDSLARDIKPLSTSPVRSPPRAQTRLIQSQPIQQHNDDDEWDSDSDDFSSPRRPVVQPRLIISKPKGENVSRISQSIENQLNNRGSVKKPAGSVNTIQGTEGFDVDDFDSDEDDNAFKPATQRHQNTRMSHNETDLSTNTYGTSQWGSSSKGVSSVNQDKRPQSKSSFVSVTDVSSDEELDLNNI
ncbi:hypothetical protein LOTGIDRAFT_236380 [Lottia gigantea]|uniref:Uncharacterized protein n=1 Tax=Lottia gigantea TaxID=225164 RepID=V3ZI51_LOTGI|nr:hypothetical protein LOTGIDRAFT_236380 [Lottia gigantea]ESO83867.1 hypothetical protein LOTGIDRAFT_236380 [Lottia gigantea]